MFSWQDGKVYMTNIFFAIQELKIHLGHHSILLTVNYKFWVILKEFLNHSVNCENVHQTRSVQIFCEIYFTKN